jgi:hypothetical protein
MTSSPDAAAPEALNKAHALLRQVFCDESFQKSIAKNKGVMDVIGDPTVLFRGDFVLKVEQGNAPRGNSKKANELHFSVAYSVTFVSFGKVFKLKKFKDSKGKVGWEIWPRALNDKGRWGGVKHGGTAFYTPWRTEYKDRPNWPTQALEELFTVLCELDELVQDVLKSKGDSLVSNFTHTPNIETSGALPSWEQYTCPITRVPMTDPVFTEDGHSYDRQAILQWFQQRTSQGAPITSPLTGAVIGTRRISNHHLRSMMSDLGH